MHTYIKKNINMTKIVIYTPTYNMSPGIRYRVDMMKNALCTKFDVKILIDKREGVIRYLYRIFGSSILNLEWFWEKIGHSIANQIIKEYPDVAILIVDVTASAIPYLKKAGIKVILCVEDLSWEWLLMKNKEKMISIFKKYAFMSDKIITISNSLQEKLLQLSLKSIVIPPCLEKKYISFKDRFNYFNSENILLHAGKIQHKEEYLSFCQIAKQIKGKYSVKSFFTGKLANSLAKKFSWIDWYNYSTSFKAIEHLKMCSIGIIIRYRAHYPTRIFYHSSMLQPIIAIGDNWTKIIKQNNIGIVTKPNHVLYALNNMISNYDTYLYYIEKFVDNNLLDVKYKQLINYIDNKI